MKVPSFDQISQSIKETFKRFPLSFTASIIGTIIAIYSVENHVESELLARVLLTLSLSAFFFTALALISEGVNKISREIIMTIGVLFMVIYIFTLPDNFDWIEQKFVMRQIFLCIGSFVAIVWAPFWKEKTKNETIWEWVRQIIMNLVQTIFFGIVIFAGISAAIFAINSLFGLDIDGEIYLQIWISVVGAFGPIFFLGNLAKNPRNLKLPKPIPVFMKILTKYILTPLAVGYFLILYSYTFKVVITGEWPKNLLGWLVIGFSVVAVFAYFLWTPFWKEKIEKYRRLFWLGLIPQIAMLFIAIGWRIQAYSWTENRYFVVILGLWLLGISLYFLINKKATFKSIFMALTAVIIVSQIGPMSGYSIGERSQKNRLIGLLENAQILQNKKIIPAKIDLEKEVRYQISDTIDYLVNRHGKDSVREIFPEIINKLESDKKLYRYNLARNITKELGFEFVSDWEMKNKNSSEEDRMYFNTKWNSPRNISGYDWFISSIDMANKPKSVSLENRNISTMLNKKEKFIEIFENENSLAKINLNDFIQSLIAETNLNNNNDIDPEKISYTYESDKLKLKIIFNDISIYKKEIMHLNGQLYLTFK